MNQETTDRWAQEKCVNVIKHLIEINNQLDTGDELNNVCPTGETVRDQLHGKIYAIYWDITKLLARSYTKTNWKTTDRDLIINKGNEGLEELVRIYSACDFLQEKDNI